MLHHQWHYFIIAFCYCWGPATHILELRAKGTELKEEKDQLNKTLTNMSEKYRGDLEASLKQQREELQNNVTDEVARVKAHRK